jgi:hypothetical protein
MRSPLLKAFSIRGSDRRRPPRNCRIRALVLYLHEAVNHRGRVAQLGERGVRNAEVEGSNPFASTKNRFSIKDHMAL